MIICPNCNKNPLYLKVTQTLVFTINNIGLTDVSPTERVEESGRRILECLGCNWKGWLDDYHQAKNGIIKMHCKIEEGVPL